MIRDRHFALAFWLAGAFALVMASLPHPPRVPGDLSDKAQHATAFAVLTLFAALGHPRVPKWRLVIGLSLFGAFIEAVQAIPALHRDSDWLDWVVDTAAILMVLALITIIRPLLRRARQAA
ncbi:hypothetical protein ACMGDH_10500 [Sphingomonas sp. DT-207]|uniref:hypothetical protein n=1 Tax=Sphingomonas sp. DT-207 TaxID=3396167 RepID=UPI003F19AF21